MPKITPAKQLEKAVLQDQQGSYLMPLLHFVNYEQGKDSLVIARMPMDIAAFDEVYRVIEEQAKHLAIHVSRKGKWPNANELRELLGSVRWLWTRWIPIGFITLLVGEPGSGKSFLALDWVRHVLCAEPWPLTTEVSKIKAPCAIWVETESSQQLVTSRSLTMGIPGDILYMPGFGDDMLGQPDLLREEDRARIVRAVEELEPTLLVVDSLGGAHTGGENKIEEVRPMLDFLARLARDEKIPCVTVHHLRKRSPGETIDVTMDRVRGSSAFSAFARSIVAVEGLAGGKQNIRVIKSNLAPKPPALSFEVQFNPQEEPLRITYNKYEPPSPKRTKAQRCAEWVAGQLEGKSDGIQLSELVKQAEPRGFSRGMLYAAQELMGNTVKVSGDGRNAIWSLTAPLDFSALCPSEEDA